MEQSPRGFSSNTINPKSSFVVTQPFPDIAKNFLSTSLSEDLLNLSQTSQTPVNFSGNDAFEKFFIKFNLVASEIEALQRSYPQLVSAGIVEKLGQLKRDTALLTRELKKIDSRATDNIGELESKCDYLQSQVSKLKDEVENLVAINSDLHLKLSEAGGNKSFLDLTPRSSTEKVNSSQLMASEDKANALRTEIKELTSQLEFERKEKKSYFAQVEWLRTNLEDHIKKYNEVLQEKLAIQDTLKEFLKEGADETSLIQQLHKQKENEVEKPNKKRLLGQIQDLEEDNKRQAHFIEILNAEIQGYKNEDSFAKLNLSSAFNNFDRENGMIILRRPPKK